MNAKNTDVFLDLQGVTWLEASTSSRTPSHMSLACVLQDNRRPDGKSSGLPV